MVGVLCVVVVAAVVVVVDSVVVSTVVDSVLVGGGLGVRPVVDVDVRFSKLGTGVEVVVESVDSDVVELDVGDRDGVS